MVQGKFKSGRLRKSKVKVPGGRTATRYLERKPKQAHCAETGEPLHGIPRRHATDAKNAPKTSKRPERPYGGVLASEPMRKKMRDEARVLSDGAKGAKELFGIGSLCLKIAGRDAGKRCVIIDVKDGMFLIDGETRRRTCSVRHLEPLGEQLALKKGASHAEVRTAFKKLGVELTESKPKKAGERPRHVRKAKAAPEPEAVKAKKAESTVKAKPATPVAPASPSGNGETAAPTPQGGKATEKAQGKKPAAKS